MPFKKGQSGNPDGPPSIKELAIKWEVIDKYISTATQKANDIVEGTDVDFQKLKKAKDKVEARLKAIGLILKLAPQRVAGADGGEVVFRVMKYNGEGDHDPVQV